MELKALIRGDAVCYKDLNGKKVVGTFYEHELQKRKQNNFIVEKVIKKKGKC